MLGRDSVGWPLQPTIQVQGTHLSPNLNGGSTKGGATDTKPTSCRPQITTIPS